MGENEGTRAKVLVITAIDIPYSIHQRTHDLLAHLPPEWIVSALYFSDSSHDGHTDYRSIRLPRSWLWIPQVLKRTNWARSTHQNYDVVIAQGPWAGVVGAELKILGRVGTFVYEDLDFFPGDAHAVGQRVLVATVERSCIRIADGVICVGHRLATLRRAQGAKAIAVVRNGVDNALFGVAHDPHDEPTLVYSGSLAAWSGLDLVIRGMKWATKLMPGIRLCIAGYGERQKSLMDLTRELGLEKCVQFMGRVPYGELPKLLGRSDVGLSMFAPGELTRFASPLKVVEYMAAGLPVAVTEDTEAADFVAESGAGLVVPYDAEKFAFSVTSLLLDHDSYTRCSRSARQAAKDLDWSSLFKREAEFISDIQDRRSASSRAPGRLRPSSGRWV